MQRSPETRRKVLLLDDHPIVLLAVKTMLSDCADFELCETPKPGHPLLAWVERQLPDLVILDLLLDGRSGLDLLPGILRVAPAARVVIYSSLDETRHGLRAFRLGAKGYVMKSAPHEQLLEALRKVAAGGLFASESVLQLLIDEAGGGERNSEGLDGLSIQQLHVFRLLGEGYDTAQIAARLGVSLEAVQTVRERIKQKLHLLSGVELVRSAEAYCESESSSGQQP
ncbi:DNA-binding response regulator, NarL/FixJ family [Terrimicrobium sacchariphilum]|uniref:DNA-binding response regulator, NarL/FixJ family n=1 Tax=Terrimicrobium sacchariphilum TaxID=690879 RepID=A0A146GAH5_TERSA|nr:response regulator transcription factor [Terrimicrobium sacchariphilum]GAT34639.1 DNA-binding response regulator, NarL/FixJ family [Terrimicrobium sacchariphilum]